MSKWALLQSFYCLCGVGFFIRDLNTNVPMQTAMIHAFIWPYAQWMLIESTVRDVAAPLIAQVVRLTS
jgi:hypothetical protein